MKPVATAKLILCACGCKTEIWDRDNQYRKMKYKNGHQRRVVNKIIDCACGCGKQLTENSRKQYKTNKNYRKRKYIAGHQNRKAKDYGKDILCACNCGETITQYRYGKNGKKRKVKMRVGHMYKGKDNHLWQGGKTDEAKRFKQSGEYKRWRKAVFERDNYTCQECGARNTKGLGRTIEIHPDHIKPFSQYPKLRTELSNGRTLCIDCHRKTDTYGIKLVHSMRQQKAQSC